MVKASAARRKMRDSFFGTNPNPYHQCVTNQLFTSHGKRKGQCWELPVKRISSSHFFSFQKSSLFSQFLAVSRFCETKGIQFPVKRVIWAISITTHDSKLTFFTRFVILRHSFSTVSSLFGWVVLLSSDTDHHFLLPPHPIPSHNYKTETAISDAAKSTHDKLMCSFHFGNPDSMQSN